ncbi:MAG: replicative DNA helicase [Candidatus Uhrbacteria bacterium]
MPYVVHYMAIPDRIPPQNLEAEQSLLGALLIDKDVMVRVSDCVKPQDFYRDAHQDIYAAMVELYERREPIDLLSLANKLEERGKLERVGGRSALVDLSAIVPTAAHARHYAEIVAKKATLRRLIAAATHIAQIAFDEGEDTAKTLDESERRLFEVSQQNLSQSFVPIKSVLSEAFDRIDQLHREKGKMRGIPTGFSDLDNLLAGFQRSDLVVIAARPSVGKTSLALDIARNAAIKSKEPVGIFSLEMSKEQLVDRLICTQANVELWRMRTGKLSDRPDADDFPRIGDAMGVLSEAPIFIDDSALTNVMEIRAKSRRLQMEHGLGMIIIDYLQLMEGRGHSESRVLEVAEITRGLKGIARELNVPVVALSQLSRAVEMTKPAIPKLSHLRESGSIEQDADVVLFIYRKAADRNFRTEDLTPEERNTAEIHIAKHRNGPTGLVKLFFDDARVCFRSLEQRREYVPALPA